MKTYSLTNPPQRGADLIPLQSALKTDKFYSGSVDGIFSAETARACKSAKYRLGYPIKSVDMTGGQQLLDYLTGKQQLPLAYQLRRHTRGYGITAEDKLRAQIIAYARWGVKNEPVIHYAQIRPMPLNQRLPMWTDCSGFATLCYYLAKGPDPNGMKFDGYGYTGTMLDHGQFIYLAEAKIADLVIWGESPGHHVALISNVDNSTDPLIIGMGNENQPKEYRMSTENAAQGGRPWHIKRYINV